MRKHFLFQNLLLQTSGSDPKPSPLRLQTRKHFGLPLKQVLYERHLRPQELQELLEGEKIAVVSTALKNRADEQIPAVCGEQPRLDRGCEPGPDPVLWLDSPHPDPGGCLTPEVGIGKPAAAWLHHLDAPAHICQE